MYSSKFSYSETLDRFNEINSTPVRYSSIDEYLAHPYAIFSTLSDTLLESLAQRAATITRQRFGNMIRFFIPLYLSNECYNKCTYCGFSYDHDIDRYTLSDMEVQENVDLIVDRGFQHILLLTGESKKNVDMDYFKRIVPLVRSKVSQLGMEVQPLDVNDYKLLIDLGLDQITVYQETYHKDRYLLHHISGKKRRFDYRLDTADRACQAGIFRVNIGALLGLSSWQFEAIALVDHLNYLQKKYWKTHFSVSFPRITSIFDTTKDLKPVMDRELVQLICAFRCLFPDVGITLSTRESAQLRDGLLALGITDMSAESMTSPGAYSGISACEQFAITDNRSLSDIRTVLNRSGLDSVVKDWDRAYAISK